MDESVLKRALDVNASNPERAIQVVLQYQIMVHVGEAAKHCFTKFNLLIVPCDRLKAIMLI